MPLHFRDRMNLKAPIYFSTGLTEKVLYSETHQCINFLFFPIGFISDVCKISHGFLKVFDHSAIILVRLWKMLRENFLNIQLQIKIAQTKSSNKVVQKELNVGCEFALFSWLDCESLGYTMPGMKLAKDLSALLFNNNIMYVILVIMYF